MKLARIQDTEHAADGKFLARPLLEGDQCNVRIIRLARGQTLPPHRHRKSDLMLYVADGAGELDTPSANAGKLHRVDRSAYFSALGRAICCPRECRRQQHLP